MIGSPLVLFLTSIGFAEPRIFEYCGQTCCRQVKTIALVAANREFRDDAERLRVSFKTIAELLVPQAGSGTRTAADAPDSLSFQSSVISAWAAAVCRRFGRAAESETV